MSTAINEPQTAMLAFGDFCVNANKRLLLTGNGESVPLMPKAFDTLLYLVERSGKIVSKDELMSAIWADRIVEENNRTQHISILRVCLKQKPNIGRRIFWIGRFLATLKRDWCGGEGRSDTLDNNCR